MPETDAIFDNIKAKDMLHEHHDVKRLSMGCKATVNLGAFARGGKTRGSNQALDPDFGSLRDLEQQETRLIQLKIDNGPESSGIRTQFLKRIVDFSDEIGRPIQLLYYPPYYSKYNPIERC